jgi:hypothetical protein
VTDDEQGTLPWSLSDVRTTSLTIAVGIVLLGWSWFQASGTAEMSSQVSWLAVSVFAAVMATAGSCNWVWAGRRAVRVRRIALVSSVTDEILGGEVEVAAAADGDPTAVPVTVPGTDRYHRDDCLLVQGKRVEPLAEASGRRPCEMCRP